MQNNMDILKKFRYNFHYWLKNCYQNPVTYAKYSGTSKNSSNNWFNLNQEASKFTYPNYNIN